jgi:hypothetical protein
MSARTYGSLIPCMSCGIGFEKDNMTDKEKIERALTIIREQGESREGARQNPVQYERNPSYHQKQAEREGRSEWSGGSMGGGTWAGRSR